jgi:hypothetical protein
MVNSSSHNRTGEEEHLGGGRYFTLLELPFIPSTYGNNSLYSLGGGVQLELSADIE